ncbi:hypothetical protein H6G80_25530 [Nostoc sp. FACHB-87]|uniref:hypothetical protein n=1 Tax=Nostocales TaxID=1161 RepID=UPI001686D879|nr:MULTISPECIES: hypothetical protein [Nostocales]MBD2302104.1 hypothetical protein [Nostoc sp. FACHB-190]MBD2457426.1 hypothetical protein [Nostoc sp. FACHB-87]MBD2476613.1 hypothetical protein [Anabaena sp. FACHB-83]MBD2486454.1 hypothetical protein [Aulosira sp. FACHB-615]
MLSKHSSPAPFTPVTYSAGSFSMKAIALAANNDNFKDWEPLKIEVYERSRR